VVTDEKMTLTKDRATADGVFVLSFGKKKHFQLRPK
jgi:hypothetical protein